VIIRIATEGQYDVADIGVDKVNELDNAVVAAVEAGDRDGFKATYDELIALVREGRSLDDDDLNESALILPPPDLTFEEAGEQFTGEGLIPD
jgi:hypothetical protein